MANESSQVLIDFFQACEGDCLLVSYNGFNVLVDGGPTCTFDEQLKHRLNDLNSNGEIINRFIVTHIDSDHIGGAIRLLEENGNNQSNSIIPIEQIWFNGYRSLFSPQGSVELDERVATFLPLLAPFKLNGGLNRMISAKQGSTLTKLIREGGYLLNIDFSGGVITDGAERLVMDNGISFEVLSPNQERIDKLKGYWQDELNKLKIMCPVSNQPEIEEAFEYLQLLEKKYIMTTDQHEISFTEFSIDELSRLPFEEDRSVTNGSSIGIILGLGGKLVLLLGDAHPSVIIDSLKAKYPGAKYPIQFDLIKVSHHGSRLNTNPELLSMIDSSRFLISTNGVKHNHPDLQTLAIIVNRDALYERNIIFNHPTAGSNFLQSTELQRKFKYNVVVNSADAPQRVVL
jgi:beta-lactamase superfamily II metal-dependent hydrolase